VALALAAGGAEGAAPLEALPHTVAAPLALAQPEGAAVAAAEGVCAGEPVKLAAEEALGVGAPVALACCEEGDARGVAERTGVAEGDGGGARKVTVISADTENVPAKVMSRYVWAVPQVDHRL
jgi:hypothetical protein